MSGSSVAAMVVGTIFIMIFGMATVSLIESVDESVKVAEFKLPNPEVDLITVTDKVESTGAGKTVDLNDGGTGYDDGQECNTTPNDGSSGSGLQLDIDSDGDVISGVTIITPGSGYAAGDTLDVLCAVGNGDAVIEILTLEDSITITISNTGSETVELSRIYITLSITDDYYQGIPFQFSSNYSGSNLFIFPGEEITSDSFPLEFDSHGFDVTENPTRAFLAVYDYSSAISVTDT